MVKKLSILILVLCFGFSGFAQDSYLNASAEEKEKTYLGGEAYKVKTFKQKFKAEKPKNIILLIGDGMGVTQVFSGLMANGGHLFLENCKYIGFSRTQPADKYITDSGAGGTALSAGIKTYNGAIAVDVNKKPVKTILEAAEEKGFATGLISTSAITHATPASFIAHQPLRSMYEEIAADFLKTDIDVFIGGGRDHFVKRKDSLNLVERLIENGYRYEEDMSSIKRVKRGKLVALVADIHLGRVAERGDMLPVATKTAINILSKNDKGFFLMVEGSQIDWGGHANSAIYVAEEMLDFDKAIGKALAFAAKDGETLIVVTADHETGGMAITGGVIDQKVVKAGFSTKGHTAVMVPVFAYGPGAEEFIGIMENTEIHDKMMNLLLGE